VQCGSRRSFLGYQACRQHCSCPSYRLLDLPMTEASHRTCHAHQVRLCTILHLLCIANTCSCAFHGQTACSSAGSTKVCRHSQLAHPICSFSSLAEPCCASTPAPCCLQVSKFA
jgi:hypothetical protein